jgi:Holliday junction resolvase
MVNSNQKGKRGERELAEVLRRHGYDGARRGQQRSGVDQPDVIGGPEGWHIEAKFVERLNIWAAWAQAERDAQGKLPMVAMKRSRSGWLAVVPLDVLLGLIRLADPTPAEGKDVGHDVAPQVEPPS